MKRLYLASSIDRTAESIAKDIGKDHGTMKLAFITTAAEAETGDMIWLDNDRKGLVGAGFELFDYTITDKTKTDLEKDLKEVDVVHLNGGTTFYLLLQARKSGFDSWVKKAVNKGTIYTGSSAGSLAASTDIELMKGTETREYEKELGSYKAFGLVDFIALPHWGNKDFKDKFFSQRLDFAFKQDNKIILLNDWQYVKVEGDMYKIIDVRD
ncbi:Type 1 glutamine amidotransferase-like domain-containing protein [Patescibacteria group bacterium]|nr:Type 1 glutamine amidotransferase-like domain-containing protein [Patescibacteria group bacterium]